MNRKPTLDTEASGPNRLKEYFVSLKGSCARFFAGKPDDATSSDTKAAETSAYKGPPLLDNIHSDILGDCSRVCKELWMGRNLYRFLLDCSHETIATQNNKMADVYVSEWEGCLSAHDDVFHTLNAVFVILRSAFEENDCLPLLRTWMFFLKEQGITRVESETTELASNEEAKMFSNALSISELMPASKYKIKVAPWVLHNGDCQLIIKRGELEVTNDSDM